MKCKCPACARTTQVPPDLLDFLTRCERCGALLRPRLTATGHQGESEKISAQTIISGRYREDPFAQRASVLDILIPAPRLAAAQVSNAITSPVPETTVSAANPPDAWHTPIQDALREFSETIYTLALSAAKSIPRRQTPAAGSPANPTNEQPEMQQNSSTVDLAAASETVETADTPHDNLMLEAANLAARQRALRRAQLQTSHHTLGWIGACGFTFVLLLLGMVLLLKSTGIIGSPRSSLGGIMSPNPPGNQNPVTTDVLEPAGTQPASTQPGELFPSLGKR